MASIAEMSKSELADRLASAKASLARARREERSMGQTVAGTIVGVGSAALMGYHEATQGSDYFWGMSTTSVVGVAAAGLALSGVAGEFSPTLLEVGRAGLYAEGYKQGADAGRRMAEEAQPGAMRRQGQPGAGETA